MSTVPGQDRVSRFGASPPPPCELLLVFPNNRARAYGTLAGEIAAITPPVEAGLLASYLAHQGLQAQVLDADALGLLPEQVAAEARRLSPRLVTILTDQVNSGDVTKMAAAGETARMLKLSGIPAPVLMAGNVPSACPEKVLREEGADLVCQGEPYEPLAALVAHLRAGGRPSAAIGIPGIWARDGDNVLAGRPAPRFASIDALPYPAWDMLPPARYRSHHWHCFDRLRERSPYAAIFTNMGCPHACDFCCVNVAAGGPNLRLHSADYVCGEIDVLVRQYGVRNIRILDHVFTARMDRVEELCDRIAARWQGLNFWAYARVDSIRDPGILRKMKRAGVNWLAYGFEAAHDRVRAAVRKGTRQDESERVVEWTRQAGINIVANFIFGLPEDDAASMQQTLDMATMYNFEWVNFYCAMAYPGTSLHERARRDGIPLPASWSAYGQYSPDALPLPTRTLSSAEVLAFRDRAFEEYYARPAYQEMLRARFGEEAVAFLRKILSQKVRRAPTHAPDARKGSP